MLESLEAYIIIQQLIANVNEVAHKLRDKPLESSGICLVYEGREGGKRKTGP
jgi:hypothetical protein